MTKYSVALCSYNGAKYIEQQLRSILGQSIPPDEIVISDDCSSDETLHIVERLLRDSNVSYVINRNLSNLGVVKNFEQCILSTRNDIVFLSDQDDVWLPIKAEGILREFDADPDCCMVFSNASLTDEKLHKIGDLFSSVGVCTAETRRVPLKRLAAGNIVTGATAAIRKRSLAFAFPFPSCAGFHDEWLAVCSAMVQGLTRVDASLTLYRQHSSNVVGMAPSDSFLLSGIRRIRAGSTAKQNMLLKHLAKFSSLSERAKTLGLSDSPDGPFAIERFYKIRLKMCDGVGIGQQYFIYKNFHAKPALALLSDVLGV